MKMQILKNTIDEAVDSVSVEHGGTAARTKKQACINLGLVSEDQVRQPDGIIVLGEDGTILKSDLPSDIINADIPSLFGPIETDLGQSIDIYITNYSSDVDYVITAVGGSFVRSLDKITFTGGNAIVFGDITVNGKLFDIYIGPPKPLTPSIISPSGVDLNIVGANALFGSSAFIPGKAGDTHVGTDWQISLNGEFTQLVAEQSGVFGSNLLTWFAAGFTRDTWYQARVRYIASSGGVSLWSAPLHFKTKLAFVPSKFMADIYASDIQTGDIFGTTVAVNNDASRIAIGSPHADINGSSNQGAVYVYERNGHALTQAAKVVSNIFTSVDTQITLNIPIDPNGTPVVVPAQGLAAYPNGLPPYNAGQSYIAPAGDPAYPSGLPPYVAPVETLYWELTAGTISDSAVQSYPTYPRGDEDTPSYFGQVSAIHSFSVSLNGGLWRNYTNGQWTANHSYSSPVGNASYPAGFPVYNEGRPYIAPVGDPAYPSGLPVYIAESTIYSTGGQILVESDSPLWTNQTFFASAVITVPKDNTFIRLTGQGSSGKTTQSGGQGLAAYPSGLPAYNPGQPYVAPSSGLAWSAIGPSGLVSTTISPLYSTGGYSQPGYSPSYVDQVVDMGSCSMWNGVGYQNYSSFTYRAYSFSSSGQPYIAAVGNPAYPTGLPVYVPAGTVTTTGVDTSAVIGTDTYTFPGGVGGVVTPQVFIVNSPLGNSFGYALGMSDDGNYVIAATNTVVPKKKNTVIDVSPTGSIRIQTDSPSLPDVTYTTDAQFNLPSNTSVATITGKGDAGATAAQVNALDVTLAGAGSITIPARVTSLSFTGKGADGDTVTDTWLKVFPDGAIGLNNRAALQISKNNSTYSFASVAITGNPAVAFADSRLSHSWPSEYAGEQYYEVYQWTLFYLAKNGKFVVVVPTHTDIHDWSQPGTQTQGEINIGATEIKAYAKVKASSRKFAVTATGDIWRTNDANNFANWTKIGTCPVAGNWQAIFVTNDDININTSDLMLLSKDGNTVNFSISGTTPTWGTAVQSFPATDEWIDGLNDGNFLLALNTVGKIYRKQKSNGAVSLISGNYNVIDISRSHDGIGQESGNIRLLTATGSVDNLSFYDPDLFDNDPGNYSWFHNAVYQIPTDPANIHTGAAASFNINGQNYTFPGGVGVAATSQTQTITLQGLNSINGTYSVPVGGVLRVQHAMVPTGYSTGTPSNITIGEQLYTFPGGYGGPATLTSFTIDFLSGNNAGSVAICQLTQGAPGTLIPTITNISPPETTDNLQFGYAVDMDGTGLRAAISAPGYVSNQGHVHIYVRANGIWTQEATVIAGDWAGSDRFGSSIALSNDGSVLVVGAPGKNGNRGAVYVFKRNGVTWSQESKLVPPSQGFQHFGASVDIATLNDRIVIGAPETDIGIYSKCGMAYVFTKVNNAWVQTAILQPTTLLDDARFGVSVSLDGEGTVLAVGANLADYTAVDSGVVYTYMRSGDLWYPDLSLTFPSILENDQHGISLAMSLDTMYLVAGTPLHDVSKPGTGANTGLVTIYEQP